MSKVRGNCPSFRSEWASLPFRFVLDDWMVPPTVKTDISPQPTISYTSPFHTFSHAHLEVKYYSYPISMNQDPAGTHLWYTWDFHPTCLGRTLAHCQGTEEWGPGLGKLNPGDHIQPLLLLDSKKVLPMNTGNWFDDRQHWLNSNYMNVQPKNYIFQWQ
jgi:hypothetical protein